MDTTLLSNGAAWLAGEASGDYLASLILPELGRRLAGAPQFGIGGERMQAAGLIAWHGIDTLAVRGYAEVIKKLPGLVRLRSEMIRRVLAAGPRVFVGVDAPDFNLGIECKLRAVA
ncbi:MAG: lipid-A-disaccharide synthase, partial [Duodenibacillus sp.]|nr:lipid-A-disaccharide synthase [Duodenibacillus sp.]